MAKQKYDRYEFIKLAIFDIAAYNKDNMGSVKHFRQL